MYNIHNPHTFPECNPNNNDRLVVWGPEVWISGIPENERDYILRRECTSSAMKKGPWLFGVCRGWNTTQLYGWLFHKPWHKDPVINQPVFHGKYPSFFFSWLNWHHHFPLDPKNPWKIKVFFRPKKYGWHNHEKNWGNVGNSQGCHELMIFVLLL